MWNVTMILTMTTQTVLENGVAVGVSLSGSHLFSAGVPCLKTIASWILPRFMAVYEEWGHTEISQSIIYKNYKPFLIERW